MFVCGYVGVILSRKIKEERGLEMIPIKIQEDDENENNQNIIIKDED